MTDSSSRAQPSDLVVDLVDGTYELFRHFYGLRRFTKGKDPEFGAVLGVLRNVATMLEGGSTHIGVATDHVIESFRNELWDEYKTGEGIEPALLAQFHPLEEALAAMGVTVWAMVELEADDALASAARLAALEERVAQVRIWTPDKDLSQSVIGDRVVQVDRKSGTVRNASEVEKKFGVPPDLIPDFLALVGDAADGYPGIPGIGAKRAARLLAAHGAIEAFPDHVLGKTREAALLFKRLATLRSDAPLFAEVDEIRWKGATPAFPAWATKVKDAKLVARCEAVAAARS
jgi:5'-3' exonuclease